MQPFQLSATNSSSSSSTLDNQIQIELQGLIASAGFRSGDRLVCGHWTAGPLGPMNDVMWATADNRRVLIAPTQRIADFVAAVYRFDEVVIAPVEVKVGPGGQTFEVTAGPLRMTLYGGPRIPVPLGVLRRPAFTRFVESPIALATMKLRTYGKTPSGMEEWYRVDALRYLRSAEAWNDGESLGEHTRIDPPLNMGVSDPPRRGSIVNVRPLIRDASGKLAEALT